jgi:hypothetical protein
MKKIFIHTLAALPLFAAAQVPSYVPTNGLVGWWPFNGNANDESGNGNNGTNNGPMLVNDRNNIAACAYFFDGVDDFVEVPHDNSLNFSDTDAYTISLWIKPEYNPSNPANAGIISKWNETGLTPYPYTVRITTLDSMKSRVIWANYIASTATGSTCGDTVVFGAYSFLTVVIQNNQAKYYVDAILVDSILFPTGNIQNTNNVLFGRRQNVSGKFFKGIIDDIGIWNRALTPCEIEALYNSGNSGLTLTTSATNLCVSDGSATLLALPSGGTWSGTGVTGNAFNPAVSGAGTFYAVYSVTNASGCVVSDSVAITVDVCTGITENTSSTFTIFPNPANNNITVSWSTADIKTLTLRDAAGRVVRTYNVNGTQAQLSLEGLASGVYFLSVGGDTKAVRKIIKQ